MSQRCQHDQMQIALLLSGDLTCDQQALVHQQLADCPACRALYRKLQDDDRNLHHYVQSHRDGIDRIEQRTIAELTGMTAKKAGPTPLHTHRVILLRRWAAAAVVLIGLGVLLYRTDAPTGSGVAWAEVPGHLEDVQTLMYNIRTRITGFSGLPLVPEEGIEIAMTVHVSTLPGFWQYPEDESRHPPGARVFADGSGYVLTKNGDDTTPPMLEQIKPLEIGGVEDVRSLVETFVALKHKDLGIERVNGVEAACLEVTDPALLADQFDSLRARLWVGAADELPVKLELNAYNRNGKLTVQIILDDFFYGWEQDVKG